MVYDVSPFSGGGRFIVACRDTRRDPAVDVLVGPGSAVDEANITRNLERYAAAGLGGVHIIPIYGAMGAGGPVHSLSESALDADARPYGFRSEAAGNGRGHDIRDRLAVRRSQIGPETAARKVQIEKMACEGGTTFRHDYGKGSVLAIRAVSESGGTVDLAGKLPPSGELVWDAPDGRWTVYALVEEGTGQKVKRAAPGGEGLVMDYFSPVRLKAISRGSTVPSRPPIPRSRFGHSTTIRTRSTAPIGRRIYPANPAAAGDISSRASFRTGGRRPRRPCEQGPPRLQRDRIRSPSGSVRAALGRMGTYAGECHPQPVPRFPRQSPRSLRGGGHSRNGGLRPERVSHPRSR